MQAWALEFNLQTHIRKQGMVLERRRWGTPGALCWVSPPPSASCKPVRDPVSKKQGGQQLNNQTQGCPPTSTSVHTQARAPLHTCVCTHTCTCTHTKYLHCICGDAFWVWWMGASFRLINSLITRMLFISFEASCSVWAWSPYPLNSQEPWVWACTSHSLCPSAPLIKQLLQEQTLYHILRVVNDAS